MGEIREVFIFLSFTFIRFFKNFLLKFVYFFLLIFFIILFFFINYKTSNNIYLFVSVIVILMILSSRIQYYLFLRNQFYLNFMFFHFLNKNENFLTVILKEKPRELLKKTKINMKKKGIQNISKKLLTAFSVIEGKHLDSLNAEQNRLLKILTFKYMFVQFVVFIVLLIPFAIVSFLFTLQLEFSIRFLIFFLGFIFAYFLNSAIVDPIFYLIVQKKVFDLLKEESKSGVI